VAAPHALERHVALVGFMGAGKSTLGPQLAERLRRPFVSVDTAVEERAGTTVSDLFETRGEAAFRELEEETAVELLGRRELSVLELGGGGLGSPTTRAALAESAFTLHLEVTPDEAWERVAGSARPLAVDPERFRALYAERHGLYAQADATARDLDGAVLAAAGIHLVSHQEAAGDALVADEHVAELHGVAATHLVPSGEAAKSVAEAERLWRSLRLERRSTLVAVGGGTTLDLAGLVAATYLRGVDWIAVPTTLVAQVDAAIGGKTAVSMIAKERSSVHAKVNT